jgi:hypothetical protein
VESGEWRASARGDCSVRRTVCFGVPESRVHGRLPSEFRRLKLVARHRVKWQQSVRGGEQARSPSVRHPLGASTHVTLPPLPRYSDKMESSAHLPSAFQEPSSPSCTVYPLNRLPSGLRLPRKPPTGTTPFSQIHRADGRGTLPSSAP